MFSKIRDETVFGWIVHLSGKSILIVCCYIPPENGEFNIHVETSNEIFNNIETHARKIGSLIIYGDFNFPSINW